MFDLKFTIVAEDGSTRTMVRHNLESAVRRKFPGKIQDVSVWERVKSQAKNEDNVSILFLSKDPETIRWWVEDHGHQVKGLHNVITKKLYPPKQRKPEKKKRAVMGVSRSGK